MRRTISGPVKVGILTGQLGKGGGAVRVKLLAIIMLVAVAVAIVLKPVVGLALLLCSYAYCLPLALGAFAGVQSEWRAYDLAFMLVVACLVVRSSLGRGLVVGQTLVNKPLPNFVLMCCATSAMTAFTAGLDWMPVVMVRLFRLTAYATAFILVVSLLTSREQVVFLMDLFVATAIVVAVLSTLEHLRVMPHLWSERYAVHGAKRVATLSPHHEHIRLYMLIGLAMLIARAKTLPPGPLRLIAYSFSVLLVFPMFAAKSRTAFLGLAVYVLATLVLGKSRFAVLSALGIGALRFFLVFGAEPFEFSKGVLDKQMDRMTAEEGLDPTQLSRSRMHLCEKYPDIIANYPAILIWGTGFVSAGLTPLVPIQPHNNYANELFEQGILGLTLYLLFLRGIWKHARMVALRGEFRYGRVFAREYSALFLASIVTNMPGGPIGIARAMMSLLRTIMFLTALCAHPVWVQAVPKAGD